MSPAAVLSAAGLDFADLVQPTSAAEFFDSYWERRPLHVSRRAPGYYSSLFSGAALEDALFLSRPKPPDLRVVAEQQDLLPDRFVNADGGLNLNQLYKSYGEGYTIIVNGLQRYSRPLAVFCAYLQGYLGHVVLANCYLSPATSKALLPHYDTHDVFVLQVEGSKDWQVYAAPIETPLLGAFQPVLGEAQIGDPLLAVRLEPGDLLYLPRGYAHQAATTDRPSLHVTLGIHPIQWTDLVAAALTALSLRDVRFRKALPPGYLDRAEARDELRAGLRELTRVLSEEGRAEDALTLLEDRLIRQTAPVSDGHFAQVDAIPAITVESVVAKRPGMTCRLLDLGSTVGLQFPGNTVTGPAQYLEGMRFVADATAPFAVADLPDSLDEERKLGLVQRLVRGGLLRIEPAEAHRP